MGVCVNGMVVVFTQTLISNQERRSLISRIISIMFAISVAKP